MGPWAVGGGATRPLRRSPTRRRLCRRMPQGQAQRVRPVVRARRRRAMIPPAVFKAVQASDVETVRTWVESGAPRDDEILPSILDTLLHALLLSSPEPAEGDNSEIRKKRTAILHLLLQHGADANARYASGRTALHWCRHPEEAAILLDHGADIDALDIGDVTPLRCHVSESLALVHLMVCRGANLNLTDNRGLDAESYARRFAGLSSSADSRQRLIKAANFLAEVKAAGSWRAYWRAPRVELVRLRSLCDRGRAEPPSPRASSGLNELSAAEAKVLERLFGAPTRRLPNEVFWTILTLWRSSRDCPE